ncbi:uncharacterized protein [Apostichopus japonicus]
MNEIFNEDFQRSLELLPQVFELSLDKQACAIRDDTCVEKLMSWFEKSLKDRDKLCQILKSQTWQILQGFSVIEEGCHPSGICISLKLLSCLAKSFNKFIKAGDFLDVAKKDLDWKPFWMSTSLPEDETRARQSWTNKLSEKPTHDDERQFCGKKSSDEILKDLLDFGTYLLVNMHILLGDVDAGVKYLWSLTAIELLDMPKWIPVLEKGGMLLKACEFLEDESMFVVKTAEKFLSKVILMTVIKTFLERNPIHANDRLSVEIDESSDKSCDLDEQGVKKCEASSSSAAYNDTQRGLKRKLDERNEGRPSKLRLQTGKDQDSEREIDSLLDRWGETVLNVISIDTLCIRGEELEDNRDLVDVDLKVIGVLTCLLRMSPVTATIWFEKKNITKICCSLLKRRSLSVPEAKAITELIHLQLNNLARLPNILTDECYILIKSVDGVVRTLIKDRSNWRNAFQMMTPLLGLCTRVHRNECSSRDVKQLAVSLTRDMVLSLKLPSDDSDVDGFIFGGRTKQDLHSVKRCAMNFIEEIIQENSWCLVEELTSEALTAIQFVLGWIPSQNCSKSLVDRLSVQTLNTLDALLKKTPEGAKNHLHPIMHQGLELITSSDCSNMVLNKGLQVLKTFVLLYERGDAIKDPLMEKAKDVLEKQLMSLHWEARDSAVKFIGTLTENQNDSVNSWLLKTKLHHYIWDKLEDEESYVREAALNALSTLMSNQTCLNDLMENKNLEKIDIARKVTLVIMTDSGGFARRAAMSLYCTWIKKEGWIRFSVLSHQESDKDWRVTLVDQCSTIAEVVFLAVVTATRDFDWEVKLSALEFWGEFYTAIVPGLQLTSGLTTKTDCGKGETIPVEHIRESVHIVDGNQSTSVTPNNGPLKDSSNTPEYAAVFEMETGLGDGNYPCKLDSKVDQVLCCHGESKDNVVLEKLSWIKMLHNHTFFNLLLEKLSDEDTTVCERACEILSDIRRHLEELCEYISKGDSVKDSAIPSSEVEKLRKELKNLEGYGIEETYRGCLEASSEKMAPLLQEILYATDKVSNANQDIDCY